MDNAVVLVQACLYIDGIAAFRGSRKTATDENEGEVSMNKQRKRDRKKTVVSQAATAKKIPVISDDERHAVIAEAAYLLAEQRDFYADAALDDWLRAEAEINVCPPGIEK